MTYQEIINQIRDLGFSDDDEIAEFGELIDNSINRAVSIIANEVTPIVERYEFEIDETDEGYMYITMPDIDDEFLEFGTTPVVYEESGKETYSSFNDFHIEAGDTIVINTENNIGSFRVFYHKAHTTFDSDTMLNVECPLPRKSHVLVPLLASYYVWLEDEPSKAAQYYNQYEREAEVVAARDARNTPRARIASGGI